MEFSVKLVAMWWRIWIPTWRFFDTPGVAAEMWVRENGEWRIFPELPRRRWSQIFWAPDWAMYHAQRNLIERLVEEVARGAGATTLVSLDLIRHMAEGRAFRITANGQDVVVSP